jgi:hypothetical protein
MIGRCPILGIALATLIVPIASAGAADLPAVERGKKALLERAFNPLIWSRNAYANSWRQWPGANTERPAAFHEAFRERYGLHPAPYPNGDYPMGLRATRNFFMPGLTTDCLLCHGGSIAGRSYVGLGNASLDLQALYEELAGADGWSRATPHVFSNVRGTTEAGAMAVYLVSMREPNLTLRSTPLDLDLHDDLCEDPPAWWLLKKKKTMYHTGSNDARSVRSLMQFMLSPLNTAADIKKEEAAFRDIQAFILSLEPPQYPFPVDAAQARKGETVFRANCSRCHGTYGVNWTYPNKIVPIDQIGTDRTRLTGLTDQAGRHYNQTWFAHEQRGWLADDYQARTTTGYQAPPLDGIWATAPYFHNGSVPTVYHVLSSRARPKFFTRSYGTGVDAYDAAKLGWRIQVLPQGADSQQPAFQRRKVYDTTLPGRGNGGHTFGDSLTEPERLAVIEYLKTL